MPVSVRPAKWRLCLVTSLMILDALFFRPSEMLRVPVFQMHPLECKEGCKLDWLEIFELSEERECEGEREWVEGQPEDEGVEMG